MWKNNFNGCNKSFLYSDFCDGLLFFYTFFGILKMVAKHGHASAIPSFIYIFFSLIFNEKSLVSLCKGCADGCRAFQ